jgi:hypothetical protein
MLLVIIMFVALPVIQWLQRERGFEIKLRSMAALDAITEVIGRSAEMGRPIHVSPGMPLIGESIEAETVAGLSILSHVTKVCADYGVKMYATAALSELVPIMQEVVYQGYLARGKPEEYQEEDIIFMSDHGRAYATGVIGLVERENCAGHIVIGRLYGNAFLLFSRATHLDVMTIGGTAYYTNCAHLMATCDYVLVGEEIFAASAYVTREPNQLLAIFSQDVLKILVIGLTVLGSLIAIAGSQWMVTLLQI